MKTSKKSIGQTLSTLLLLLAPFSGQCFYNPSTGMWLSRDPAPDDGGTLYTFVRNNPQDFHDDLGLKGVCCVKQGPFADYQVFRQTPYSHSHLFYIRVVLDDDGAKKGADCCDHTRCDFRQLVKGYAETNGVRMPLRSTGSGLPITENEFVDDGFNVRDDNKSKVPDELIFEDAPGQQGLSKETKINYYLEFKAQVFDVANPRVTLAEKSGYWIKTQGAYPRRPNRGGFDSVLIDK